MNLIIKSLALLLLAGIPALSFAGDHTEVLVDDTVADFGQGDLTTSTLVWDGKVRPPMYREKIAVLDEAAVVWDALEIDGTRYIGTGHNGRLLSQQGSEKPQIYHDFEESSIYALAQGLGGELLAAVSPGGTIHRVEEGSIEPFAYTGSELIWDIVRHEDMLYAATGTPAGIVSIDDEGTTTSLVSLPEVSNVLDLAPLPDGNGFAMATQGPGYLARVALDGDVTILIDPEQEEVRRVAILTDGSILGAVNGERSPGEKALSRAPSNGAQGGNRKPRPESFIVRAYPNGYAEEWWTSPEAPIHDIYVQEDGSLIVAAGDAGRLFQVTPEGNTNLAGISEEMYITRMAPTESGQVLLGTGAEAAIYLLDPARSSKAIYESRAFDALGTVSWGRIRGFVSRSSGSIMISTRTGNTVKPDEKWSDWTENSDFNAGEHISESPVARFLQYRITMIPAESGEQPMVDLMRVFYTRPNSAPKVLDITVAESGGAKGNGNGEATPRVMTPPHSSPPTMDVSWKAEDPDSDILRYALYVREVRTENWVLVEDELMEPKFTLPTAAMADGEYRAMVVVSDDATNANGSEKTAKLESAVFLVDNTAPDIITLNQDRSGPKAVEVRVRVEDSAGLITSAAWRVGFGDFMVTVPEDGALDQRSETFTFTVEGDDAAAGNQVIFVATDEKGNTRVESIRLD